MTKRTENWEPGDIIVSSITGKKRVIRTISKRLSFDVIRTTCGKSIIGEDIDFWDLDIPSFDFGKDI